ncbi:OTU1 [Scenedesmus sp. PABB004]|nr:OTU1 [Scenedesmus sp. PABB004]
MALAAHGPVLAGVLARLAAPACAPLARALWTSGAALQQQSPAPPPQQAPQQRAPPPSSAAVGRLNHVAIAVPDLVAAAARFAGVLGARVSPPQALPEHGVTVVFVELPNTKLELLAPLGTDSPIAGFLRRNPAGGVHHLCLEVGDVAASLAGIGGRVRCLDPRPKIGAHGNPVVFLHPKDCDGVLLELEQVGGAGAAAAQAAQAVVDCLDPSSEAALADAAREAEAERRRQRQRQANPARPAAMAEPGTTLDADIAQSLAQNANIDQIRESERSKPYIGDVEPLAALKAEYANGSQVFVAKIGGLEPAYAGLRRTRGDGNCFFRSFIYGYLEWLLAHQPAREADAQRFAACLSGWKAKLSAAGYDGIVYEDPLDMLLGQVQAILISGTGLDGGITPEQLLSNFRDDTWSNTCVMLLRFITSAEIKRRAEHFEPFVLGQYEMDVATFCERSVDVMGEESDHIHAQALTDAVEVPIRIVQIDSSPYGGADAAAALTVDMRPETLSAEAQAALGPPVVHLLYRPGHYDLLYPKP